MTLFEIPKEKPKEEQPTTGSKMKLKKGQTINDLIINARKIVEEKLGKYKDSSKCVTDIFDLQQFFEEIPDDSIVAIDTETTGLNTFSDELVGMSLSNGKQNVYIPINHKSSIYKQKLSNQIPEQQIKDFFGNLFKTRKFKWVYHNAKFDLLVLHTFFGYYMPAPYWDTMITA